MTGADERAAEAVARHYARATGKRWPEIRPELVLYLAGFTREMNGTEAGKVERACAVVDAVVAESAQAGAPPPTPRYIFHPELYWRRLERLEGTAECRPAGNRARPLDAPTAPPRAPSTRPPAAPLASAPAPTPASRAARQAPTAQPAPLARPARDTDEARAACEEFRRMLDAARRGARAA